MFASLENSFTVWFPSTQEMKHNARQLVSGRSDRLWFSELSTNTAEELSEIVLGMVQRISAYPKC